MGTGDVYKYSYSLDYDLEISNQDQSLIINLKVKDRSTPKQYKSIIKIDEIPENLKEIFPTKEKLFLLFSDERNFEINPI